MTEEKKHSTMLLRIKQGFLSLLLVLSLLSPKLAHAYAWCYPGCCLTTVVPYHLETQLIVANEHRHLTQEVFGASAGIGEPNPPDGFFRIQHYERYLIDVVFGELLLPAMMMMTEQLVTVAMDQLFAIGTFFDARQQLEVQLTMQELTAQAHKDYHPSFGMCEFGGNMRSLAAADFKGDLSKMVLNKHFLDRQLGTGASVGSGGFDDDRFSAELEPSPTPYNRLGFFLQNTCDDNDINKLQGNDETGLFLCTELPPERGWVNRDIDFNNTIMSPRIINVDYTLDTSDNPRLFEMSNYLYGHGVFSRPDGTLLNYDKNHDNFLDSRAVTAKRSVAQNSFDSIVGLKSRGTNAGEYSSINTSEYMWYFLVELGFPIGNSNEYHRYNYHKNEEMFETAMGAPEDEISYYGQMEVLAKKIYQRPEFYTNLYDKPANVKRKSAAMMAIKSMLDRDIFDSQLRSEAILSMILELKVVEEQQNIENKLGLVKERVK